MRKYIFFLLAIMVFAGCGAGGGSTPYGSTALVNPASVSIAGKAADPVGVAPVIMTATVKDAAGVELYNARLHFIFSFETFPSETVMSDNGLSVEDLVTLEGGVTLFSEHIQDTNNAGNVLLNIRVLGNAGLAYSGKLLVYDHAGTLLTTANIEVTSD